MIAGVAEGLAAAASAFVPACRLKDAGLTYGPLVADVRGAPAPDLELAVELIYEGYLAHYRSSRVIPGGAGFQVLLLAGDYFYAHGLRSIAAAGDVGAVGLLTRLMGACSVLRVERLPLTVDDGLWMTAVAGVAAGEGSAARAAARAAFDAVEAAIRRRQPAAIAAIVRTGQQAVRQALQGPRAGSAAPRPPSQTDVAQGA
jgi:hypothetical protein